MRVARAKGDVVEDGLGEQLALGQLGDVPDMPADVRAVVQVRGVHTADADGSGKRELERAREFGGGRFARTRLTDERGERSGECLEGEIFEGEW